MFYPAQGNQFLLWNSAQNSNKVQSLASLISCCNTYCSVNAPLNSVKILLPSIITLASKSVMAIRSPISSKNILNESKSIYALQWKCRLANPCYFMNESAIKQPLYCKFKIFGSRALSDLSINVFLIFFRKLHRN